MRELRVHFLPKQVAEVALDLSACVVIDVLRATTTMVYALAGGARSVIPCLTIEEAQQRAATLPKGEAVLGGERGGLPIPGFDLGNSPAEYTNESVGGKTVVLTTTNGTKALDLCSLLNKRTVLIGAFVNLSAVCESLATETRIDLVCAGTNGQITREDVLLAGAIAERVTAEGAWQCNDEAAIAQDAWAKVVAHAKGPKIPRRLAETMRQSLGGRNLIAIGMEHDIELAAEVDRFTIVPRFETAWQSIEI